MKSSKEEIIQILIDNLLKAETFLIQDWVKKEFISTGWLWHYERFLEDINFIKEKIQSGKIKDFDNSKIGYMRGPNPHDNNFDSKISELWGYGLAIINSIAHCHSLKE